MSSPGHSRACQAARGSLFLPGLLAAAVVCSAPATASISVEHWSGVAGSAVSNLTSHPRFPSQPDSTGTLDSFDAPANIGDGFGRRVRGYIVAPTSGSYRFWVASDDASELWLSSDEQPANKRLIASVPVWTARYEWTKFSSQRSSYVRLNKGQRYYIEALHKEGSGSDHLAVAWQYWGKSRHVIPGSQLEPWQESVVTEPTNPSVRGSGLTGQYFNSANFTNLAATRVDSTIDFSWGYNAPAADVTSDNYTVRWTGQLAPVHASGTQTYTFHTTTDDGVRLWVDGKLLVDRWINQSPTTVNGSIALAAGRRYDVKLEYFEGSGGAVAKLEWETAGVSRQFVPSAQLHPAASTDGDPTSGGGTTDPSDTPVSGDADGDGMPDSWERQYGLNPNDPSDAARDADGDGYSNLEEYKAGSRPDNKAQTPIVSTVTVEWVAPTTRVDGSSLSMTEIASYRIRYGTGSGSYTSTIDVNDPYQMAYTVGQLRRNAKYYFVVTAIDTNGLESQVSNEASVVVGQ